jgi:hypothetical protein
MHKQQHTMELQRQAANSLPDPQLLTALLAHTSISQDQHIIAALQATSKQLQAAVAQQLLGQLPVVLCTDAPRRMHALAQWLRKHAVLCRGLDQQITRSCFYGRGTMLVKDVRWPDAVAAVAKALQDAATATGTSRLQSFSLTGITADAAVLQQIPLQQLTKLCVEVEYSSSASLQAVAALTGLCSLQLTVRAGRRRRVWSAIAAERTRSTADDVLAPLATGLQQLTELHVGPLRLAQLKQLPPKLQQLHVKVDLDPNLQQLAQLADWLQRHSGIIKSLGLHNGPSPEDSAAFATAMEKLTASIQAATSCDRFRLESLTLNEFRSIRSSGPLLQQLPACSLTQLKCSIDWGSGDIGALCSVTSLRSLHLVQNDVILQRDDALTSLSALQRLTQLQLCAVRSAQLAVLQLPQLLRLELGRCDFDKGQQLQLGHLTALQQLQLLDCRFRSTQHSGGRALENIARSSEGQLPPNLRELQWLRADEGLGFSVQQLLALTGLQKLELPGRMPEEEQQQLPQLTRLAGLTGIGICCSAATAVTCCALPIKALSITSDDATPAVMQQLCAFSGLTYLTVHGKHLPATMEQLSATLAQLTALQHVSITGFSTTADRPARSMRSSRAAAQTSSPGSGSYVAAGARAAHSVEGVAMLLRAVGRLPDLGSVLVAVPVMLNRAEARHVKARLPAWLQPGFRVNSSGRESHLRVVFHSRYMFY